MTTFQKIINKVANLDNNYFSIDYDESDSVNGIHKSLLNMICNSKDGNKNKFAYYNEVTNNYYFKQHLNERENFIDLFCKIQRTYHVLNKFVYRYKYKKAKLIVKTDLQLNEINETDVNVICVYHIGSKYLFKIEELLKITYMSLTNNYSFFSEPLAIKNPFNNIPFGKSILYSIYVYITNKFKIKYINSDYLDLFLKFKNCNFDMTKFINDYEHIIRDYAIKNYLNNSTKNALFQNIKSMIAEYNLKVKDDKNKIVISDEFPEDMLIKIMTPYVYLNLIRKFSLSTKNKYEAKNRLFKKLLEFQQFNPQFGRKTIKFEKIPISNNKNKIKSHIEFNMTYKKFNTYKIDDFMTSHLCYKYDGYGYDDNDSSETVENFLLYGNFTNNYDTNNAEDDASIEDEPSSDDEEVDVEEDEYEDEEEDEGSVS